MKNKIFKEKGSWHYALLIVILIPVAIGISVVMNRCYGLLINMEQEGIIISSIMGICGYYLFINTLLKPFKCVWHKMVSTYILLSVFAIPAIIVYGYNSGKGISYYIFSVFVFVTLPVIPYVMAECIKKFIHKYFLITQGKTFWLILFGILINLVLSIWGNWWDVISNNPVFKLKEKFLIGGNSISDFLAWIFPMNSYGILSLLNGNMRKSVLYFSIYFILVLLFTILHLVINKEDT